MEHQYFSTPSAYQPTLCPICNSTLKRCLISEDKAVLMCPVLTCYFPFNQDPSGLQITKVEQEEILDNVATRMENAKLDPKGLTH